MDVSAVSAAPVNPASTVAVEVQRKTQDLQEKTTQTLLEGVSDPDSSLGQNINVRA